jgi:gliding motility-associated-like protein
LKTFCLNKTNIFLCLVLFSTIGITQNDETVNWYFGQNAGLNFIGQLDPQISYDGQMLAPAGCATISDVNGNLQMYTNGDRILTKNHSLMNNGLLVTLDASGPTAIQPNKNTSQNSIIIPVIDIENLYYVFTVGPTGLLYSVVDMSLFNGLGSVIEVNNPLLKVSGVSKLSAVHHADGKSIWLMTTKQNDNDEFSSFYAYKINTDGSIEPPVITSSQVGYKGVIEGIMKFSPDGEQIACANYRPKTVDNHLGVFDFDNATGIVRNKKNLLTALGFFEVVSVYGIEFSNDSKYLYATLIFQGVFDSENPNSLNGSGNKINFLYQYNLESFVPQEYITILHEETNDFVPSSLQLSRNGKIYRALSKNNGNGIDFLGVINTPDVLGFESNYSNNSINLTPKKSIRGLPNFIQSYFRTRIINKMGCLNELIPFEVDTYADITGAIWDFGDGNISYEINPYHAYSSSGNYNVSVTITVNNRQIQTEREIFIYDLPNLKINQELIQCDDNNDGISVFDLFDITEKITYPSLNENLIFYETFYDAEKETNSIPNPSSYTNIIPNQEVFVRVINENNCYAITSFFLSAVYIELGAISNMYACFKPDAVLEDLTGLFYLGSKRDEIKKQFNLSNSIALAFYPSLLDAQTTQNEITGNRYISTSKTIWVRAIESDLSCAGLASIKLIVNEKPIINIEDSYIVCADTPIILLGDSSNDRFEWLNSNSEIISTQQQFSTTNTGVYTHIAYKIENGLECSNSKNIIIERVEPPIFNKIEIDTEPNNNDNFIFVSVKGKGSYEFSLDNIVFYEGLNQYTFYNVPAGIYTVYVRDVELCEPTIQQDVYVIGYPKFFSPNNDGYNDYWQIKGIKNNAIESIEIFDRFGKIVGILNQKNNYKWNGSYYGKELPTDDYWFKVILNSGTIDTGHFTLKR